MAAVQIEMSEQHVDSSTERDGGIEMGRPETCAWVGRRFIDSGNTISLKIGSEEMVTTNQLAELLMDVTDKKLPNCHLSDPLGIRAGASDYRLVREQLETDSSSPLRSRAARTLAWIADAVSAYRKLVSPNAGVQSI